MPKMTSRFAPNRGNCLSVLSLASRRSLLSRQNLPMALPLPRGHVCRNTREAASAYPLPFDRYSSLRPTSPPFAFILSCFVSNG